MKILRVVILLAFTVFIFSCKKDSSKKPGKIYLPVKITNTNNVDDINIEYNADNLISRFTIGLPDSYEENIVSYNSDNQPVKIETFYNGHLDIRYKFTFDNAGKVIRNDGYSVRDDGSEHFWFYDTYTYNSKNQLITLGIHDSETDTHPNETNYSYDGNGNIAKQTGGSSATEYQYDNKKGVFKHAQNSLLYWYIDTYLSSLVNNAVLVKYNNTFKSDKMSSYEYNHDGYPTRIINKYDFGWPLADTTTIEYKVVQSN